MGLGSMCWAGAHGMRAASWVLPHGPCLTQVFCIGGVLLLGMGSLKAVCLPLSVPAWGVGSACWHTEVHELGCAGCL